MNIIAMNPPIDALRACFPTVSGPAGSSTASFASLVVTSSFFSGWGSVFSSLLVSVAANLVINGSGLHLLIGFMSF